MLWFISRYFENKRRMKRMLSDVTPRDATWLVALICVLAVAAILAAALYFGTFGMW